MKSHSWLILLAVLCTTYLHARAATTKLKDVGEDSTTKATNISNSSVTTEETTNTSKTTVTTEDLRYKSAYLFAIKKLEWFRYCCKSKSSDANRI